MNLHEPSLSPLPDDSTIQGKSLSQFTPEPLPRNAMRARNLGVVIEAFRADPALNVVLVRSDRPALQELSPAVQQALNNFVSPDYRPDRFISFHPSSLPGGMKSYLAGGVHLLSAQDRQFFSVLDEEIFHLTEIIGTLSGKKNADLDVRTGINASAFHCDPAVVGIIKLDGPTTEFLDSSEGTYTRGRSARDSRTTVTADAKLYWPNNNDIMIFYGIPQPGNPAFQVELPFGIRPGAIHRTGQRGQNKELKSGIQLSELTNPHRPARNFDVLISAVL